MTIKLSTLDKARNTVERRKRPAAPPVLTGIE